MQAMSYHVKHTPNLGGLEKFELDENGFDNVFRAIDNIVKEISIRTDEHYSIFVSKLVDILNKLTNLEVLIGEKFTNLWELPASYSVDDRRYDCADPVRKKAEEAIRKVKQLLST